MAYSRSGSSLSRTKRRDLDGRWQRKFVLLHHCAFERPVPHPPENRWVAFRQLWVRDSARHRCRVWTDRPDQTTG